MAVVIDTDVVSFIFKKDTRSALYEPHLDGEFMILSFMTMAELFQWSLASNWGNRKMSEFEVHLRRYSIHHSTSELARLWADVRDNGRGIGKSIASADAWVAATALYYNVPLVTHNAGDFSGVQNLSIISEG